MFKRTNIRDFLLVTSYLLLVTFFSGCATTSTMGRPIASINPALASQVVYVRNAQYIPVSRLSEFYGIDCRWDQVSKKLTLQKNNRSIVLFTGSDLALVDGKIRRLKGDVILKDGVALAPLGIYNLVYEAFEVKAALPKEKAAFAISTIVLDPGHGGKDPGCVSRSGLFEKDVVLDIARRLKNGLERNGIVVLMTREDDRFVPLYTRIDFANRHNADLFVSIHTNAFKLKSVYGFEVYCLSDDIDDNIRAVSAAKKEQLYLSESSMDKSSDYLKTILWDLIYTQNRQESIRLGSSICGSAKGCLKVKNSSVKKGPFYVLKNANMPAVLIEVGYISNSSEEERLKTFKYRQELADAISNGILQYSKEYQSKAGFGDEYGRK